MKYKACISPCADHIVNDREEYDPLRRYSITPVIYEHKVVVGDRSLFIAHFVRSLFYENRCRKP